MSDHNRLIDQRGVSYIAYTVSKLGMLFRHVKDHDKGIDAELEITQSLGVLSPIIGVQIKSRSHFSLNNNDEITIQVTEQNLKYWHNYGRPVILMVYSDETDEICWTRVDKISAKSIKVPLSRQLNHMAVDDFSRIISQFYASITNAVQIKDVSLVLAEIGTTISDILTPVEEKLLQAKHYFRSGKYSQAAELYAALATVFDSTYAIKHNWSICLMEMKDYLKAEGIIRKMIALHPDNAEGFHLMGLCLTHLERFDDAEKYFRKALYLNPTESRIWNTYGLAHYWQGCYENAYQELSVALSYNNDSAEFHFNLALCATYLHKYKETLFHYDECLRLNPNSYDACNNKAVLLKYLWRIWEALYYYDRAIEIDPLNPYALINSASLLKDLGYNECAIQRYYVALEVAKERDDIITNLALLYVRMGDYAKAAFYFDKSRDAVIPPEQRQDEFFLAAYIDCGFRVLDYVRVEFTQKRATVVDVYSFPEHGMMNNIKIMKLIDYASNTLQPLRGCPIFQSMCGRR